MKKSSLTTSLSEPRILSIEKLDFPTNWTRLCQKSSELVVEIGFGSGEYLIYLSQKHPNALIIGIEVSETSINKAYKKLKKNRISNICLLKINAKAALWNLFKPDSILLIVSNFPDPWPKEKHKHHRLFDRDFCKLVASRLKLNGKLIIYTDDPRFSQWILQNLNLEDSLRTNFIPDSVPPPTRYAKKWQSINKPIFLIEAVKTRQTLYNFKPIEKLSTMPTIVLKCEENVSLKSLLVDFNELKSLGEPLIVISRVYFSPTHDDAIFDVHLTENFLTQRYFIEAKKRNQKLILKVHDTTRVTATRGVKLCLLLLARYFLSKGCAMLHSTAGSIS